jgi:hypothetical protein
VVALELVAKTAQSNAINANSLHIRANKLVSLHFEVLTDIYIRLGFSHQVERFAEPHQRS